MKQFYVYIMTNKRNGTLYVGLTSDLAGRVWQHKNDIEEGFTKKYGAHTLVYYEGPGDFESAAKREKQLKKWNRIWKLRIIEEMNPEKQMEKIETKIPLDRNRIAEFCRKWKIVELSFFGSVLRDDFNDDSDVDVLVTFADNARYSLLDVIRAENELAEIISRKVDLVQKRAVEKSKNWIRRNHILGHMESYYVAG